MGRTNHLSQIILFLVLGCSFIILLPGDAYSQQEVRKPTIEFAQRALEGYVKNTVTERNFAKLGFKTLGEAQVARLGDPYRVMFIGLADLTAYETGIGARPLLVDAKTLWFPVMVGEETRTKLEITEKEGKLVPGEFGRFKTVENVIMAKDRIPGLLESIGVEAPYEVMLVRIAALRALLLYVESPEGEYLIPAMIQPQRYGLENGEMYPADEVLSKLRDFAREIDPDKIR